MKDAYAGATGSQSKKFLDGVIWCGEFGYPYCPANNDRCRFGSRRHLYSCVPRGLKASGLFPGSNTNRQRIPGHADGSCRLLYTDTAPQKGYIRRRAPRQKTSLRRRRQALFKSRVPSHPSPSRGQTYLTKAGYEKRRNGAYPGPVHVSGVASEPRVRAYKTLAH